jgi:hypothetical protein
MQALAAGLQGRFAMSGKEPLCLNERESSNIGTVRAPFLGRRKDRGGAEEGRRRGGGGAEEGRRRGGGGAEEGRRRGGGGAEEGRRRGGRGAEADRSGFLGRRKGRASLKIQGGASSLPYVIIICNDVTRASLDEIDNSHYRLILKLGKEMQINHHS